MVSLIILFQTRLNVKVRHRSLRPTTDGHVVPRHSGGVIHAQIHEGGERGFSGRFDQTSGLILEEQREKVTTGLNTDTDSYGRITTTGGKLTS